MRVCMNKHHTPLRLYVYVSATEPRGDARCYPGGVNVNNVQQGCRGGGAGRSILKE